MDEQITIVDLKDVDVGSAKRVEALQAIRKACETDGFFHVINHGVVEQLMKQTLDVAEDFFALPWECKQHLCSQDLSKPVRVNTIVDDNASSFREYLRLHCKSQDSWPSPPDTFKEVVGDYNTEMEGLIVRLLGLISESLGLDQEHLLKKLGGELDQHLYMIKTKHVDGKSEELQLRAHRDPPLFTLVHQDYHLPGLQVMRGDEKWVTVCPVKNSIVVNVGDQLEVLSNGVYKSSIRRVLVNPASPKTVSILSLCFPMLSAVIEPVEKLVKEGDQPKYKSFRYQEYYDMFWKKSSSNIYRSDALLPFMLHQNGRLSLI